MFIIVFLLLVVVAVKVPELCRSTFKNAVFLQILHFS